MEEETRNQKSGQRRHKKKKKIRRDTFKEFYKKGDSVYVYRSTNEYLETLEKLLNA